MRAVAVGHVPQVMPMPWSVPVNVGDWEPPPWGQATLTAATVTNPDTFTSGAGWSVSDWSGTPGQADPYGGTAAYQMLETANNARHRIFRTLANAAASGAPNSLSIWAKAIGGRWLTLDSGADLGRVFFDLVLGVGYSAIAGVFADITNDLGGGLGPAPVGWWKCTGRGAQYFSYSSAYIDVGGSPDGVLITYPGDTLKGAFIYHAECDQVRISAEADVQPSRTFPAGKTGAFNVTQGTVASQPFYDFDGIRKRCWTPGATVKTLATTAAELLAIFSGLNKPGTLFWVGADLVNPPTAAKGLLDVLGTLVTEGGYRLHDFGTGVNYLNRFDGSLNPSVNVAPPDTSLHVWAGTFDGTNLRLYRDYALVAGPVNGQTAAHTIHQMYTQLAQSSLLAIQLFNRALTADELAMMTFSAKRKFQVS